MEEVKDLEDWKIKIAVLWLVFAVASIWIPLIEHYIPGFVEEAVAQVTPESVLMLVIIAMIIPQHITLRQSVLIKQSQWRYLL